MSRTPPAAVARQLRQEAAFGCAECGCPIIEYHHIIEWQEKQHFDAEHMVALCPTHHTQYGKLSKSKAYEIKRNPFNQRTNRILGYLGGNKIQKTLLLGSNTIERTDHVLTFCNYPIFSYTLVGTEYQLSAYLPDDNFWPEIEVKQNHLTAKTGDFWDIEFKTNWVKFRRKRGDVFLEIDFRGEQVQVNANLKILGNSVVLAPNASDLSLPSLGNIKLTNSYLGYAPVAIELSSYSTIYPPNYAMLNPKHLLVKSNRT